VILDVAGRRADDGSAFAAGQTNHVEITLTDTDERLAEVRDAIPSNWQVESGNYDRVETDGDVTYVYFDADFGGSGEVTFDYFAETPEETARYGFGPAEVRAAGTDEFVAVPNTTDTNAVAGQEQPRGRERPGVRSSYRGDGAERRRPDTPGRADAPSGAGTAGQQLYL
jgi:hypothetical protein